MVPPVTQISDSVERGEPQRRAIQSEVPERFVENVTRLRRAAGFTQEELASRAAIHRTQISLMEGGERQPRFETLVKLIGVLGVTGAICWRASPGSR